MIQQHREIFDCITHRVISEFPPQAKDVIERVPVIIEDRPSSKMLIDLGINPNAPEAHLQLCGLHTGLIDTEIDSQNLPLIPSQIHIFREAIISAAGGWDHAAEHLILTREIRITLLHEIGHQLGLEEDDLTNLGYQ